MKRRTDAGLEHIRKLGLRPQKNAERLQEELRAQFGESGMRKVRKFSDIAQKHGFTKAFYDKRSADPSLAMFVNGAYSTDIIRRVCNWIDTHREYFGETILEVGCELGLVTTFLAKTFPESRIVAIDRSRASLRVAEENIEKYGGIRNVTLKCCEPAGIRNEKFDTVFSLRTAAENFISPNEEHRLDDWRQYTEDLVPSEEDYAGDLAGVLKDTGTLISIESLEGDPRFAAWMIALGKYGIATELQKPIAAVRLGEDELFPALTGRKGTPAPVKELEDQWKEYSYDPDTWRWRYYNAVLAWKEKAERLIIGFHWYDGRTRIHLGQNGVYETKDPSRVLICSLMEDGTGVATLSSDRAQAIELMRVFAQTMQEQGDIVESL